MDLEYTSVAVAGILLFAVGCRESYLRFRKKYLISVQCWFCHKKTPLRFEDSNSWYCQSCEQYNGFTKDGDYNRVIPAQYEERFNNCVTSIGRSKKDWKQGNSLCESCNYNQELKIKQLASFIPINEAHYNEEIEHFRLLLQESYKLCPQCEVVLTNVLNSQQDMGPRRLIVNAIKKIESQSRPILYSTLVLSFLLVVSTIINFYGLQNSATAEVMKKWFDNSVRSNKWLKNTAFSPQWLKDLKLDVYLTDSSIGIVTSGLFIQTVSYLKHKSFWCFLNWFSWVLLVFLSWYHNGIGDILSYLQIAAGTVTFLSTSFVLYQQKTKLQHFFNQKREMDRKRPPPMVKHEWKQNNIPEEPEKPQIPTSSPRVTPEKIRLFNNRKPAFQPNLSESFCKADDSMSDLGIGKLNLGPRLSGNQKRIDPPFQRIQAREMIKRSSPLLTPPKLNLDKPMTRSSSYSSGFGSICGNSFERSNSPRFYEDAYENPYEQPGYITSYQPYTSNALLQVQPPFSPMAYYHFAAQYQRMYLPPTPEKNTSCNSACSKNTFNLWSVLYLFPMLVLLTSNLALMWTVYSKDLLTVRT